MPTLAAIRNDIRANYLPDEDEALKRLVATREALRRRSGRQSRTTRPIWCGRCAARPIRG